MAVEIAQQDESKSLFRQTIEQNQDIKGFHGDLFIEKRFIKS
jgi:hypothetical protein